MAEEKGYISVRKEGENCEVDVNLSEEFYPIVLQTMQDANKEAFVKSLLLVACGIVKEGKK